MHYQLILIVFLLKAGVVDASTKHVKHPSPRHPAFVYPEMIQHGPPKNNHNGAHVATTTSNLNRMHAYYHEHLHENAEAAKMYDVDGWFDLIVTSCLKTVRRRGEQE